MRQVTVEIGVNKFTQPLTLRKILIQATVIVCVETDDEAFYWVKPASTLFLALTVSFVYTLSLCKMKKRRFNLEWYREKKKKIEPLKITSIYSITLSLGWNCNYNIISSLYPDSILKICIFLHKILRCAFCNISFNIWFYR